MDGELIILSGQDVVDRAPVPAVQLDTRPCIARRMSLVTQEAATEAGDRFVPAATASAGHHAWSACLWTNQFQLLFHDGAAYHPNRAGMAAVAGLITEALPTGPG